MENLMTTSPAFDHAAGIGVMVAFWVVVAAVVIFILASLPELVRYIRISAM